MTGHSDMTTELRCNGLQSQCGRNAEISQRSSLSLAKLSEMSCVMKLNRNNLEASVKSRHVKCRMMVVIDGVNECAILQQELHNLYNSKMPMS